MWPKEFQVPREQIFNVGILTKHSGRSEPCVPVATHLAAQGSLSPTTILRAGGTGAAIHRGEGMRTQFGLWTSRAWGFLVDALAYSRHVMMALGSGRTHLEALPMPDEPLLSWSVYLADAPAKWLGTVEAPTAEEAVKIGARRSRIACPGLRQHRNFVALHVLERLSDVSMAAVRIGRIKESQPVIVPIEKQIGESFNTERSLIRMVTRANGAGTHS